MGFRGSGRTRTAALLGAAGLLVGAFAVVDASAAAGGRAPARAVQAAPARAVAANGDDCSGQSLRPTGGTQDGPNVERIKQRGRLIAGIDTNSFNWGFRNPQTGALSGFDIDLVHAIAKALLGDPNAVDFLAVPTAKRVQALQNGTVDIVVRTMTITCDRAKQVSFSAPYFTAGQQVVAPVADHDITGFDGSLKGKRVCAASGSTAWQNFVGKNSLGATPVSVANQLDCLVQMQLGNVDATVTDNALGAGQVAQDPSVHLVGRPLDTEYYGVAVKLGSDDLVRRINAVLQQFAATQWQEEYGKWLKASMGGRAAVAPVPRYRD